MLPLVTITCWEDAAPPPCPPDLQALRAWYRARLREAAQRGEEQISLPAYQWSGSPWPPSAGAYAVLRAAVDFLWDNPLPRRLELRCAGADCLRVYQLQWNMWFAETKGDRAAGSVTDL